MRKSRVCKRIMAVALSSAMVLAGVNVCPAGTPEAKAAVTLPKAVAAYDFTDSKLSDTSDYELDSLVLGEGTSSGATATADGLELSNGFVHLPDIFGKHSSADITGLTVSMKYKKNESMWPDNQWSEPLFNFSSENFQEDKKEEATSKSFYCSWNGNIGTGLNLYGGSGAWMDGSLGDKLPIGEWHTVTVTYDIGSNTVTNYVDGEKVKSASSDKASLSAEDIKSFAYNAIGYHRDGGWSMWSFCTVQDFSVWIVPLTDEQVYTVVTGETVKETDRTELNAALNLAATIREECYKDGEQKNSFKTALVAAQNTNKNLSATQQDVTTVATELKRAIDAIKSQLKDVDLSSDLLLNTDLTSSTSTIDTENNVITSGGYTITPMGTSTIEDGYIQSSVTGDTGKAGISLDKDVLQNVSMDKGVTLNIKWNFSTAPASDWVDIFTMYENDTLLLRHTTGFVTTVKSDNIYPGTDCRNGFVFDSCKSYETGKVKNLTFTIDNSGLRMYVDGVLACEKSDVSAFDFANVFEKATEIRIGNASNSYDQDLMGSLRGIQVYNRALNAAEVDELAAKGVAGKTVSATIKAAAGATVVVKQGETQIASGTVDEGGSMVLKGLADKTAYTYEITTAAGSKITGDFQTGGKDVVVARLTGIAFKEPEITLENIKVKDTDTIIPDRKQLEILYEPSDATDEKKVTYESSDSNIVKVDSDTGAIAASESATGNETVTITATHASGLTATCTVKVTVKEGEITPAESVAITPAAPEVGEGETVQLTAEIMPEEATVKSCDWESADNAIATVNDAGLVTGVKEGSVKITAKTRDGSNKTAEVTLTVKKVSVPVTGISLSESALELEVGDVKDLVATVTPDGATNKAVTWTSTDPTVAKVEDGKVTALKAGTATIAAVSAENDDIKAECAVTVGEKSTGTIAVTGITLNKSAMELEVGKTGQLTATVSPATASNTEVEWTSANQDVATVDATGKVTAVKAGTARITATSMGNREISASCEVTVKAAASGDDNKTPGNQDDKKPDQPNTGNEQASITLGTTNVTLYTGKAGNSAVVKPTVKGASKAVTWKSSNPKVATVSNGTIKAVKKGTATITATANGVSASVKVTVKDPAIKVKKGKKSVGKVTVKRKKTVKLTVTVSPSKSGISLVKLSAKNKKIANVKLKNGKLTIKGKKKGKVTIKIKSGKATKSIKVTVK